MLVDAKKTGALIARLRKEQGCTQKELAERLHVSDKAISRWETGKGLPDTGLLKPLSDELGISVGELLAGEQIPKENMQERVDEVIVESLHTSRRKQMGIAGVCVVLALLLLIGAATSLVSILHKPSAMAFVNDSKTHMRYMLGKTEGGLVYQDLVKRERDDGYEYTLPDGSERYVFTGDDGEAPVLTYLHCSGDGMLFGFRIGDDTVVQGNEAMGTEGYSLTGYLEEQGFQWKHDSKQYGRPTLVYVNGERCNWFPYVKDNVLINLCISAHTGRRLVAYDMGLLGEGLDGILSDLEAGFALTVEDPYGLLMGELAAAYPQWEPVTLTAAVPEGALYKTLYCYVNDQFAGKFEYIGDDYQFTVSMPGIHTVLLVIPEEQK